MKTALRTGTLASLLILGSSLFPSLLPAQSAPDPNEAFLVASEGFLAEHPDLRWRWRGLQAYRKQNYAEAMTCFLRAARYADKPAQGMIAEMHWKGLGTAVDKPRAYAWMDLAAERAYPVMLIHRERYWEALTAAEREQALAVGEAVYAEYGDDVAKARLEEVLRRARRDFTGSRTGFVGALQIEIPAPGGSIVIDGRSYYADKFWEPEQYWDWQDQEWKQPAQGRVDIGAVQGVDGEAAQDEAAAEE